MLCEMCGKETDRTKPVFVEGTQLRVCKECARFGESPSTSAKKKETSNRTQVVERLQARERRMHTKDIYQEEETVDLAPDYPDRIKEARMARDWKQETLAAKLNEKVSVISKLEAGTMRPNDSLIKKLEKELGIKLREKVAMVKPEGAKSGSKALTLADFIKKK